MPDAEVHPYKQGTMLTTQISRLEVSYVGMVPRPALEFPLEMQDKCGFGVAGGHTEVLRTLTMIVLHGNLVSQLVHGLVEDGEHVNQAMSNTGHVHHLQQAVPEAIQMQQVSGVNTLQLVHGLVEDGEHVNQAMSNTGHVHHLQPVVQEVTHIQQVKAVLILYLLVPTLVDLGADVVDLLTHNPEPVVPTILHAVDQLHITNMQVVLHPVPTLADLGADVVDLLTHNLEPVAPTTPHVVDQPHITKIQVALHPVPILMDHGVLVVLQPILKPELLLPTTPLVQEIHHLFRLNLVLLQ